MKGLKVSRNAETSSLTSEVVVKEMCDEILSNTIRHGEVVDEEFIRKRYGVKKGVASDVVRQLLVQNFLKFEPEHGGNVVMFHFYEAINLSEHRSLGECLALRFVLRTITPDNISECNRLLDRLEGAASEGEKALIHAEFFRNLYCEWLRGDPKSSLALCIANYTKYLRFLWLDPEKFERYRQDLRILMQFCERRDAEGACKKLSEQIHDIQSFLVEELRTTDRGMMSVVGLP